MEEEGEDFSHCLLCDDAVVGGGSKCGQCGEDYTLCVPCSAIEEMSLCADCRGAGVGEID